MLVDDIISIEMKQSVDKVLTMFPILDKTKKINQEWAENTMIYV